MPHMEDSEADTLPASSEKPDKKCPSLDKPLDCSPHSNTLNQSPTPSPTLAANPESAESAHNSAPSMTAPHVETKPLAAASVVDDDRNALVGTKRKMSKDERPPAKKARTSIELENKQVPVPMSIPAPVPTPNPSESNTNTPLPDPIDKGPDGDKLQVGQNAFHFEYDENGYGDDADRQKLSEMSDVERKAQLEDRIRRRGEQKQLWEAKLKLEKPHAAVAAEAEEGETDDSPQVSGAPLNALVRQNAKSEETVVKEEKVAKVGDSNTTSTTTTTVEGAGNVVPYMGRPFLRSSPIATKDLKDSSSPRASPTKSKDGVTTATAGAATTTTTTSPTGTTGSGPKKERSKKKRNVSWAKDDDLVQVVSIYNRMELIKSWDPQSEITLPFTPLTLTAFRNAIQNEARAEAEAANPTSRTDAFAPGNDANDEERRRRDYKAARQRKLDEMQPTIEWPQKGTHVVLPPECKPEDVAVKVTLHPEMDDGEVQTNTEESHDSSYSPRSPPPDDDHYPSNGAFEIPWADPSVPGKVDMHQDHSAQQVPQHNSNTYHSNGAGGVPQFRSQQQSHHHHHGAHHQNHQHAPYQQEMDMRGRHAHSGGYSHNIPQRSPPQQHYMNGGPVPPHMMNNNGYNHPRGAGAVPVPDIPPVDLQSLLHALHQQPGGGAGGIPPPPPPSFSRDGMPHPPPPPPPRGFSNGQGQYYPVQGMPMAAMAGGNRRDMEYGLPPPQLAQKLMSGRSKIKKKCKYFGTKQGCRDGAACMFSHAP